MDSWPSAQEKLAVLDYTPVHFDADYPDIMQEERWTRVEYANSSESNETVSNTDENTLTIMGFDSSTYPCSYFCNGS